MTRIQLDPDRDIPHNTEDSLMNVGGMLGTAWESSAYPSDHQNYVSSVRKTYDKGNTVLAFASSHALLFSPKLVLDLALLVLSHELFAILLATSGVQGFEALCC